MAVVHLLVNPRNVQNSQATVNLGELVEVVVDGLRRDDGPVVDGCNSNGAH